MTAAAIDEARRLGPVRVLTAAWVALAPLAVLAFASCSSVAAITLLATPVAALVPRLRDKEDVGRPGDFARLVIRTVAGIALRGSTRLGAPMPEDHWKRRARFAVAVIALRLRVRMSDPAVWAPHAIAALLQLVRPGEDIESGPEGLEELLSTLRKIETEEGGPHA